MEPDRADRRVKVSTRIVVCVLVLVVGVVGMIGLANLKAPPAEVAYKERPIRAEAVHAVLEDIPVLITGYGEVRALDTVSVAPEVAGKVVEIHPRLEGGEIIPEGEVLFGIDPSDYEAAFERARATVDQWEGTIERLRKQYATDQERLRTLRRSRDLAREEFGRVRKLFEEDRVGTRSGVDAAERAYNAAEDVADSMEQAVVLYPIRIREAESSLAAARASLKSAEISLSRCQVRTSFRARIKDVSLEQGQYVMPGQVVLTLANDAILEIHVPLDSRDARDWLRFDPDRTRQRTAWFGGLEPVTCTIRWTEDPSGHVWHGKLHRVVRFDQTTRTLTVAIRVPAEEALSVDAERLPLVEGMFCSVEIPGRTIEGAVRLPRWAVSFQDTVFVSREGRLKTQPVKVGRVEGEEAFVTGGLNAGDVVITTRLIDPMENSLLELRFPGEEEGAS